jgi:histidine triad (HIT) family protein
MQEDCLFCSIIQGRIPARKVFENDRILAFHDINPQAPVHILLIPKHHVDSIAKADALKSRDLAGDLLFAAAEIARQENLEDQGYRLVINHGADGGQTVGHLHVHLLGGRVMTWPPG